MLPIIFLTRITCAASSQTKFCHVKEEKNLVRGALTCQNQYRSLLKLFRLSSCYHLHLRRRGHGRRRPQEGQGQRLQRRLRRRQARASTAGCPFGEGCHFLHYFPGGHQAVAKMSGGPALANHPGRMPMGPAVSDGPPTLTVKTRLCNKYNAAEGCKWGDKCHFAHGEGELGKHMFKDNPVPPPTGPRPTGHFVPHQMPTPGMATPASFGVSATAKISVDASLAGAIIGRGGINTKQISRVTGAKLAIRDHESNTGLKNIELEGTFDQIRNASTMVRELIVSISGNAPPPAKNPAGGSHRGPAAGAGDVMSSEPPDGASMPREEHGNTARMRRRITYSSEFLLSVAASEACHNYTDKLPAGVDASLLRAMRWHWGFWARCAPSPGDDDGDSLSRLERWVPRSRKSRTCTRFFSTDGCPFGDDCRYLHYLPGHHHDHDQAVAEMKNLNLYGPALTRSPGRRPMASAVPDRAAPSRPTTPAPSSLAGARTMTRQRDADGGTGATSRTARRSSASRSGGGAASRPGCARASSPAGRALSAADATSPMARTSCASRLRTDK